MPTENEKKQENTYTPPDSIWETNEDDGIARQQARDMSINQDNWERQAASVPLNLYNDSDVCQGMKKVYDWTLNVTRPMANVSAEGGIYSQAHAFADRDNTELNSALQNVLNIKSTTFDQLESVSFETLKSRLAVSLGNDAANYITKASLENALSTGEINIIRNGEMTPVKLDNQQLSSINAYFHMNENAKAAADKGIKEVESALKTLGYDIKTLDKLNETQVQELILTGRIEIKQGRMPKEITINHIVGDGKGGTIKSPDAILIENNFRLKGLKTAVREERVARNKTNMKGKGWINKGFADSDVYQGHLKIKNSIKAVKSACIASLYVKHYAGHVINEKVIKKAENAFLKVDLGIHGGANSIYVHSTKFVDRKEKILNRQTNRKNKFEKKQKKLNERRNRRKMNKIERIKTSKLGKRVADSKIGVSYKKTKKELRKKMADKTQKFLGRHKLLNKMVDKYLGISGKIKKILSNLLHKVNIVKSAIMKVVAAALLVIAVYMGLLLIIDALVVVLSVPLSLLEDDDNSAGQSTVTMLRNKELKYLDDIEQEDYYDYTEICPYDPRQKITVDDVEVKRFVNENGSIISSIGIYKQIFTMVTRHYDNSVKETDLFGYQKYCSDVWDIAHSLDIEYETYEHAVYEDSDGEVCSNWQTEYHYNLSGTPGYWVDDNGQQCTNYTEHAIPYISFGTDENGKLYTYTEYNYWASCNGHDHCFGHIKATVTPVVITDLHTLIGMDPDAAPSGKWDGWTEENLELADVMYEQDWEDFGIHFPGSACGMFTAEEINDYVNQIAENYQAQTGFVLSGTRISIIREALLRVGQYSYVYSANHTPAQADGTGSDCSGYVGQVLYQSGACFSLPFFNTGWFPSAAMYTNSGWGTNVGSAASLVPGDIIVKNSEYGGSNSSTNHVVIYIGVVNGEQMIAECTTWNGVSGSQLNPVSRVSHYKYWLHMPY